jgi:hypothetical protein
VGSDAAWSGMAMDPIEFLMARYSRIFADGERFQILCSRVLLIANVILGLLSYNSLGPAERWEGVALLIIFLALTTVVAVRMQFRSVREQFEAASWVALQNDRDRTKCRIIVGVMMLSFVLLNSTIVLTLAIER